MSSAGWSGWPENKCCPMCGCSYGKLEGKTWDEVEAEEKYNIVVDVVIYCGSCDWISMASELISEYEYLRKIRKDKINQINERAKTSKIL